MIDQLNVFFKSKACLPFIGKESYHVPKAQSVYVSKSSKRHFIFFHKKCNSTLFWRPFHKVHKQYIWCDKVCDNFVQIIQNLQHTLQNFVQKKTAFLVHTCFPNLLNLKIHLHNPAQGRQSDSLRKRSGLLYIRMNFWMEVEGAPREREGFPLKEKWHEVQLSNNTFGIYQYQESWVLNYGSDFMMCTNTLKVSADDGKLINGHRMA